MRRLARTPLAQYLQQLARQTAAGQPRPSDATTTATTTTTTTTTDDPSRRSVLRLGGAAVAAGAVVSQVRPSPASAAGAPTIAVVGAGLAGLTCAYELRKAGVPNVTLYEASNRVGGRAWTATGDFQGGQIWERGGRFIDSGHRETRRLARELSVKLVNVLNDEPVGSLPRYFFDNVDYPAAQVLQDFQAVFPQFAADVDAAGYPTLYNRSRRRGRELDQLSITQYLQTYVPQYVTNPARAAKFIALLTVAYTIEFGIESSLQSSLNMLYLIGFSPDPDNTFTIFGASDERFAVKGGTSVLVDALAARVAGFGAPLRQGHVLNRITRQSNGRYTLLFRAGSRDVTVTADRVVLTVPFTILRERVNFANAGFRALKRTAIQQLSYGTNTKLVLQFVDKHWETLGSNGDTFTDLGYQNTWSEDRGQGGNQGLLMDYLGGDIGARFTQDTPANRAQQFLGQVERVLPGVTPKWNGRLASFFWPGYKWSKGSYSAWKVGEYTRFAGVEGEAEGACHFAGEHTSPDYQGYLNGAVFSGQRAAGEIRDALAGRTVVPASEAAGVYRFQPVNNSELASNEE